MHRDILATRASIRLGQSVPSLVSCQEGVSMFSPKLRLSLYVCLVCLLLLSTALAQTPPTTVTFNTQTYTTGASPTGVVSGDFNEDGKPDLAVIDNNSN